MKLTLKNIKELKSTATPLEKRVLQYITDEWGNYDDKKNIFTDVLNYGCQSGMVGFLIYYSDSVAEYDVQYSVAVFVVLLIGRCNGNSDFQTANRSSYEIGKIRLVVLLVGFSFDHYFFSHFSNPPYAFFPIVREIFFASALDLPSPSAFLYLNKPA